MEINKLKLMCTTLRLQNLRKAADLHGFSPGGASKAMKEMQEELGIRLFVPQGRGIIATQEGKHVGAMVEKILLDYSELKEKIRDRTQASTTIRLASFEVFTSHFMGKLATDYFPDQTFICVELSPGQIETAVAQGDVDFGITYAPLPHEDIDYMRICRIEMGVFIRRDTFKGLNFKELPFAVPITSISGSPSNLNGLDAWPLGIDRKVAYRMELLESALILCRRGKAAIHCPKFIVRLQNEMLAEPFKLVEIPFPKGTRNFSVDVYIVKRRRMPEDAVLKRIAKALRIICS